MFLASTPGLYRKKCKACQDDNHFKSKECKRCGGALDDIQSPGRPRGTTASEGYGVSVVQGWVGPGVGMCRTWRVDQGWVGPGENLAYVSGVGVSRSRDVQNLAYGSGGVDHIRAQ